MTALSLVEKGWAAARSLSLELAGTGIPVRHLVKGRIPRRTLEVLTPRAGVTIQGVPQRLYRLAAWCCLWLGGLTGSIGMVITDNSKTASWVRRSFPRLREGVLWIGEHEDGRPKVIEKGASVRLP